MFALWLLAQISGPAPASESIQQQFDSANAALQRGDAAAALAGFDAIGQRPTLSIRTRALAKLRAGIALYELRRIEESERSLREGLAGTPTDDASLTQFRIAAMDRIGAIEEDRFDLAAAADTYGRIVSTSEVEAPATGHLRRSERHEAWVTQVDATEKQIRTMMFVDASKAIDLADKALAAAAQRQLPETTMAEIHRLRGLALVNAGRFDAARESLRAALALDPRSPAIGSDLALLTRLAPDAGKPPKLYYRLDLPTEYYGRNPAAPRCGEVGLKNGDFGVVQLQIADDGTPFNIRPIYSSAGSAGAILFARMVTKWQWPAQQPKPTVPQFYRLGSRVEARCSQ